MQRCIPALSLFNTCLNRLLGKVVDQNQFEAFVVSIMVNDLAFPDDAVLLVESLEILLKYFLYTAGCGEATVI